MSRSMKHFADYFMQGMQLGAGWAEKWQAGQIAKARNQIMQDRNAAVDKRENAKLGLYGEQVRANAELARARAYRAMNPVAKGGKGGGDTNANPGLDDLTAKWSARDGMNIPSKAPAPVQNNYYSGDGDGGDGGGGGGDAAAPVEGGYGDTGETAAKGGMIRGYDEGGIVSGMSLGEAQSYQGRGDTGGSLAKPKAKPQGGGGVMGALGSSMAKGAANYKAPEKKKPDDVRPTGPVGTGPGGSYTTADTQSGGALDTTPPSNLSGEQYEKGGAVRYASNEEKLIKPEATPGMADVPVGRGRLSLGANYDPNGRYGTAEAGYEHPVGRDTTIGIRGDIGKDLGPEGASAKPNWGVGVRGRIKFNNGGRVRNFQSGGRVMEAIDTGTSGPGSGYGYRAAPPARR